MEYWILCKDNHSFLPISDSDVEPGIDTEDDDARNYENEDNDDKADVRNNYATLDY